MYNVLQWLEESQEKYSSKIAVIDEMGEVTYDELVKVSKAIGSELTKKEALESQLLYWQIKE